MNTELFLWITFLIIGSIFILGGCIYLVFAYLNRGLDEKDYFGAAIFEFAAAFLLYYPVQLYGNPNPVGTLSISNIIYGVLSTFVKTVSVSTGNGYDEAYFAAYPVFATWYGIVRAIAAILLLVFLSNSLITFALKSLRGSLYSVNRAENVFLFSEYNEKTLAIAKSVANENNRINNIVFIGNKANLKEKLQNAGTERLLDGILDNNFLFLNDSLENVLKGIAKKKVKEVKLFLYSENEGDNIIATRAVESVGEKYKGKNIDLRVFVEINSAPWSMFDKSGKSKAEKDSDKEADSAKSLVTINYIRTEENFAYNNFFECRLVDRHIEKSVENKQEKEKNVKVLIAGYNERTLEIFKTIIWLLQIPDYRISIVLLDDKDHKSVLQQMMPEIQLDGVYDFYGDAVYEIRYVVVDSYQSIRVEEELQKDADSLTYAFINIGDDLTNVYFAQRLNALLKRNGRKDDYLLQVNMLFTGKEITDNWNKDLFKEIRFVGDYEQTYSYEFITNSRFEKLSEAVHIKRQEFKKEKNKDHKKQTWEEYCNNEYNRHQVYSRTLNLWYKYLVIKHNPSLSYDVLSTTEWKNYEHMRWNLFQRVNGIRNCPDIIKNSKGAIDKELRTVARVHVDLVEFDMLSQEEKDKDDLPELMYTFPVFDQFDETV